MFPEVLQFGRWRANGWVIDQVELEPPSPGMRYSIFRWDEVDEMGMGWRLDNGGCGGAWPVSD